MLAVRAYGIPLCILTIGMRNNPHSGAIRVDSGRVVGVLAVDGQVEARRFLFGADPDRGEQLDRLEDQEGHPPGVGRGGHDRLDLDHDLHEEMSRVFGDIQKDPDCDVVVLTGQGRAFCAGGDMDWFQEMIDQPEKFRDLGIDAKRIVFDLLELEKPIICRLNGAAAGLGASIALMCDIIIADEEAVIGDPHVKVGLVAGDRSEGVV